MLWTATRQPAVAARAAGPEARARPADGDEAAFRSFYEATARPLWAYLARAGGDPALADDLLQEAYYRLLRSGFAGEGAEHRKNYLFRIATNLLRDHFRRRRPEEPLEPREGEAAGENARAASTGTPSEDLGRDLGRILARLPIRERQLVWLAHVEGASHREIAAALGLKEGSVRVLLFRTRRKLAGLLREAGLAPEDEVMR